MKSSMQCRVREAPIVDGPKNDGRRVLRAPGPIRRQ